MEATVLFLSASTWPLKPGSKHLGHSQQEDLPNLLQVISLTLIQVNPDHGKRTFRKKQVWFKTFIEPVKNSKRLFFDEAPPFPPFPPIQNRPWEVRYIPEPGDLIIRVSMVDAARPSLGWGPWHGGEGEIASTVNDGYESIRQPI